MKLFFTCLILIGNLGLNAQSMAISEAGNALPKAEKIFKEAKTLNMKEVKRLIGYPELCWEAHLEGKVFIQVQSDALGNYLSHRVKFATNRYFQYAVEEQVCNLKFNPAYYRGKKVASWIKTPYF